MDNVAQVPSPLRYVLELAVPVAEILVVVIELSSTVLACKA